jgi:hypothetical protein
MPPKEDPDTTLRLASTLGGSISGTVIGNGQILYGTFLIQAVRRVTCHLQSVQVWQRSVLVLASFNCSFSTFFCAWDMRPLVNINVLIVLCVAVNQERTQPSQLKIRFPFDAGHGV